ncbi:MAG: lysylphosphatidylglycerol synthase transmembrane domain-containing protein [Candidatus Altiarchaeota archaeon]
MKGKRGWMPSTRHLSVLGLILFAALLLKFDAKSTLMLALSIKPAYIISFSIFVVLEVLLRSLRWKILVNRYRPKYSLREAFEAMLMGVAFGAITPGRVGDIIKAVSIRGGKVDFNKALSIEIVDRLIDLFYIFLLASCGYLFLAIVITKAEPSLPLLTLILAALASLTTLMFFTSSTKRILGIAHNLFVPEKYKHQSKALYGTFNETMREIREPKLLTQIIILTIAWWTILSIRPYFITEGLGYHINPLYFLLTMPVVVVIELIPVSILGIGTREAGLILVFSVLGAPAQTMLTLGILTFALVVLPQTAAGFLIAYLKKTSLNKLLK